MKKILLLLLALICSLVGARAQKFTIQQKDGQKLEFKVISKDKKAVMLISAANKGAEVLDIPSSVTYKNADYKVVLMQSKALMTCDDKLRDLIIPSSIKEIGEYQFGNFLSVSSMMGMGSKKHPISGVTLRSLKIGEGVETISNYAFITGMGSSYQMKCLKAHISELPSFVNDINCEIYGIGRSYVTEYLGPNSAYNSQNGAELAAMAAQANPMAGGMYMAKGTRVTPTSQTGNVRRNVGASAAPAKPTMNSDVDINIPEVSTNNDKTFAIIIANEDYQEEVDVDYALNDGIMFKTYCHKVLGLPEENVHMRQNATLNNINAEMDWLSALAQSYGGEANVIIYYAGHGIPDEATGTSYLLPVDGMGKNVKTGYSLQEFYKKLGSMPLKNVFVFMDACFSGSQRGNGMLASARGVAIRAKAQAPQGNMVVLSAAQGDETAYPYKEKGHGLFTYYLLKKLQNTKGNYSMKELGEYVKQEVSRRSIVTNQKSQTPVVSFSNQIADTWQNLKLK